MLIISIPKLYLKKELRWLFCIEQKLHFYPILFICGSIKRESYVNILYYILIIIILIMQVLFYLFVWC